MIVSVKRQIEKKSSIAFFDFLISSAFFDRIQCQNIQIWNERRRKFPKEHLFFFFKVNYIAWFITDRNDVQFYCKTVYICTYHSHVHRICVWNQMERRREQICVSALTAVPTFAETVCIYVLVWTISTHNQVSQWKCHGFDESKNIYWLVSKRFSRTPHMR